MQATFEDRFRKFTPPPIVGGNVMRVLLIFIQYDFFRMVSAKLGDKRMKLISEMIENIYTIKACAWEITIAQSIDKTRTYDIM